MAGLTIDSGPLISAERNDREAWLRVSRASSEVRTIPTVVLAQCWRGPTSARIAMLLVGAEIEQLTEELAKRAGVLLARSGTSDAVDAIIVASAATRGDAILTSDPEDLRRLAEYAGQRVRIIAI